MEKTSWISVKDKLPEHGTKIICYKGKRAVKESEKQMMAYFLSKDQWDRPNMFVNSEGAYYDLTWVTHWMPLPEPPKK